MSQSLSAPKVVGIFVGGCAAIYGGLVLYENTAANVQLSQRTREEKKAQLSLDTLHSNLKKHEKAAVVAEVESRAQELEVSKLKQELKQKEEEADAVRQKITAASKTLAAQLDAVSSARKAAQELQRKIIAGKTAVQSAASDREMAQQRVTQCMKNINPLTRSDVRELMGK